VDSPSAAREALRAGAVKELFVGLEAGVHDDLVEQAAAQGAAVVRVPEDVLAALADTSTPQGVIAVVTAPRAELDRVAASASLMLVLADVRDPGNAGTLVRASVAAAADAIVFARGSVDALHPKTLRAAAGYTWHIPIVRAVPVGDCVAQLRTAGLRVIGTSAAARSAITDADLCGRTAIVVGNEGWGLEDEVARSLDASYRVPMPGPVESLNVAVAGAIALYEAVRQRQRPQGAGRTDV